MKNITLYSVVFDRDEFGKETRESLGRVLRFRSKNEAQKFSIGKTHYGKPAEVIKEIIPLKIAERWGIV